jgi:hypothetical protein
MGLPAQDHYDWATSFTAIEDPDGVLQSITPFPDPDGSSSASEGSEAAEPVVLEAADLNGAVVLTGGKLRLPRRLTFTLSSTASAWNTDDPIVVEGKLDGSPVTIEATPTSANGNIVLRPSQAIDIIDSITIPEQPGAGSLQIGVGDVVFDASRQCQAIKPLGTGNLKLVYGVGLTEALPVTQNLLERIAPREILSDPLATTPTSVGVTLYF